MSEKVKKTKEASKKALTEFKEFALKGNIIDMAVGVIIGGAFGTIVSSLVSDIVMPLISSITGNIDFTNKFIVLGEQPATPYATLAEAQAAGANTLNWGTFVTNIINFIIIAVAMFIIIKKVFGALQKGKKTEKTAEPDTKECQYCLSVIPKKATRCPHCTSELK